MYRIKITKEIEFETVEKMRDYFFYDSQAVLDGQKENCINSFKSGKEVKTELYRSEVGAMIKTTVKVGEVK